MTIPEGDNTVALAQCLRKIYIPDFLRSNNFHLLRPLLPLSADSPGDSLIVAVCNGWSLKAMKPWLLKRYRGIDVRRSREEVRRLWTIHRRYAWSTFCAGLIGTCQRLFLIVTKVLVNSHVVLPARFPDRCLSVISRMPIR
jgi:hypothetical protein